MSNELRLYTGQLKYKEIDFTFVFDGSELRLLPPREKREEIWRNWIMTPLGKGIYTMGQPMIVENPILIGRCNESSQTIIFIIREGNSISNRNTVLFIRPDAYIVCKYDREMIDRISFSSAEINCIHPVNQAFYSSFNLSNNLDDGVVTITAKDFASTTTKQQEFMIDGKRAYVEFGVTRGISYKIGESPLMLTSSLIFDIEPTNDYVFIYKLWRIAKCFIQYLCYRRNVSSLSANLFTPYANGQHESFATLYVLDADTIPEPETLRRGRYIKQQYISGCEGKILSDIANGVLYFRHLPDSYESGRHYTAARFVMITAAFEWEFSHTYPQGIPKKECRLMAEEEVHKVLQALIEKSAGKVKSIYKYVEKMVGNDSLQSKLVHMSNDYDSIIGLFGRQLYGLNNRELIYSEMGKRLADQRNHFAHGDLDEEMITDSFLDLMFLEYVIYAMQLKRYGVSDRCIQMAINDLFHLCISETEF